MSGTTDGYAKPFGERLNVSTGALASRDGAVEVPPII